MPKAATATQAAQPEGCLLPREAAKATSSVPAGRRRSSATKKGPVLAMTPFMATMAVPQKKKGDTSDAHSHHSLPTNAAEAETPSSSSETRARPSTKHSTSVPVPTQSTASGGEGGIASRRKGSAPGRSST
uniref:Uncharacterized protein n=1 Tax=Oryza nivara TaxID=4536 RepID=A0A0E0FPZ1_ORYNI